MKRITANQLETKKISKRYKKIKKENALCGMWSIKICLVKSFIFGYPLNQILEKKN